MPVPPVVRGDGWLAIWIEGHPPRAEPEVHALTSRSSQLLMLVCEGWKCGMVHGD